MALAFFLGSQVVEGKRVKVTLSNLQLWVEGKEALNVPYVRGQGLECLQGRSVLLFFCY